MLAAAFNLSDIFEYMSPAAHEAAYRSVLDCARPGARIAYWNMMVPRRAPASLLQRLRARDGAMTPGLAISLIKIVGSVILLACVLRGVGVLGRRLTIQPELARKIIHICWGCIA